MSIARIPSDPHATGRIGAMLERSPWLAPLLACLAVVATRANIPTGVDVSALITWAERLVDGARPFVDFLEVNPPGSILLYVPGVMLGRALGLSPEASSELIACMLIALSLGLCWRILAPSRLLEAHDKSALLAASIAILGVMPATTFGQREHIGIIALLPILALAAAEAGKARTRASLRIIAGLLAGISMIAKPHFGLILAATSIYVMVARHAIRPALGLQWLAAGATFGAYIALTYAAYPEFYETALPKIADVYLGWRVSIPRMIINPVAPVVAMALIIVRRQHAASALSRATIVLTTAGIAATAIFYLQGRAWPYHALPAIVLFGLTLAFEATSTRPGLPDRRSLWAMALAVPALTFAWSYRDHDRDLTRIAAAVSEASPRPRMLAIAEDISVGHPLVRRVDGTWVHRVTHLWSAFGFYQQVGGTPPISDTKLARLVGHLNAEIDDLAHSIEQGRPDIIVAQVGWPGKNELDWLAWAHAQPALAAALGNYESVARIDDVEILARVDRARLQPNSAASR